MKKLYLYAGCIYRSDTMSGGDRIFIELARRWVKKQKITLITSKEGKELCEKYGLKMNYLFIDKKTKDFEKISFFLKRLVSGIKFAWSFRESDFSLYSTSNFVTDVIPCALIKLLNKKVFWIAGYYLEPPNPFYGYDESKSSFRIPSFSDFSFYFQNKLSKFIIRRLADTIYVTSFPDSKKFRQKTVIIKGGVDIKSSKKIKNIKNPEYGAVFIGRFHQQKGVLELIDIWQEVLKKKPDAKLAMIGNGPLEAEVARKIKEKKLEKSIILFGFMDGIEKIKVFKNSRIVLHPASYDSGGMAACEAMAARLPGVSYDLEALKTYYPKGMIKVEIGNKKKFAETIIQLLQNRKLFKKTQKEAFALAKEWSWDKRAQEIYRETFK